MLKRKMRYETIKTSIKFISAIVPIVLLLIFLFFMLTSNEILTLSKANLTLESQNCAEAVNTWARQILSELNIYKRILEKTGIGSDKAFELMQTSYGTNDAYPFGLYWGDATGRYLDSSGWVPGEDFVVTERDWYQEGMTHEAFSFGKPYVDARTGSICVSVSVREPSANAPGVLAADVYMDDITHLIAEAASESMEDTFVMANENGIVLTSSASDIKGIALTDDNNPALYQSIGELLQRGDLGQHDIRCDDGAFLVDLHPIETTGWYFISFINRKEVLQELRRVEGLMILLAVIASLGLMAVTLWLAKNINRIETKAQMDALTHLLNRDSFQEKVLDALKECPGQGILVIIDLDNFKLVNDQLGHPTGDLVLRRFASLLAGYFNRNKDIVARLGGDEFSVFVGREILGKEVHGMLDKFVHLVYETFQKEYAAQNLSVSVGAAFVTADSSYDTLYQNADDALYHVKRQGKNGFQIR